MDLFVAGNALMEATTKATDHLLQTIALPKGSMRLVEAARMLELEQEWKSRLCSFVPAGAECNVATGMAFLGGSTFFTGRVGSDARGNLYEQALQDIGVATDIVRGPGHTGLILSFVTSDFERSMFTHLGEAACFAPHELKVDAVKSATFTLVSGFFFQPESTRATAFKLAEEARRTDTSLAFDTSDGLLVKENGSLICHVIEEYADIVFVNETELTALGAVCGQDPLDYLKKHVPMFAAKHGSKGASIFHEGGRVDVDAFPVQVVDTTGAGDAFAAGFLFGLSRGRSPKDSARLGCLLASKVVAQYGSCLPGKAPASFWKEYGARI